MTHPVYPTTTSELAAHRAELAPETHEAFQAFSRQVFADGALPEKTKQLIAVAVAHVTQCPYCIRSHTRIAVRKGAMSGRSWRRSGSPPRCAPEAPTPTPSSRSTPPARDDGR